MTPEQIRLVTAVIEDIDDLDDFAARFYRRLFASAPDTAPLFGDLDAQRRKLGAELTTMVEMLGDLDRLEGRSHDLGERHRAYGVRAGHYRVAREALSATLAEVLGDRFGAEERAAWDRATSLITELMQSR